MCMVLAAEPKALNRARPCSREATASSHWKTNSTGMVIARAAASNSGAFGRRPARPNRAQAMRGSSATKGTPMAVPMETPQ